MSGAFIPAKTEVEVSLLVKIANGYFLGLGRMPCGMISETISALKAMIQGSEKVLRTWSKLEGMDD